MKDYLDHLFRNESVGMITILLFMASFGVPLVEDIKGTYSHYTLMFTGVFLFYLVASAVEFYIKKNR